MTPFALKYQLNNHVGTVSCNRVSGVSVSATLPLHYLFLHYVTSVRGPDHSLTHFSMQAINRLHLHCVWQIVTDLGFVFVALRSCGGHQISQNAKFLHNLDLNIQSFVFTLQRNTLQNWTLHPQSIAKIRLWEQKKNDTEEKMLTVQLQLTSVFILH